ncbi:MAG: hypothetical protein CMH55_02185 [Myxococcales bacterium]|nr:hypothetical protein [Myxococcales bacterium]
MIRTALCILAMTGVAGCESSIAGNEGQLRFAYDSDDDVFNFNKPIAVGAALDLRVADFADQLDAVVVAASTKDTDVLEVLEFSGNTVTLIGTGKGSTLVKVSANDHRGIELDDSVNMMARQVEVLRMNHTCTDDVEGHYLAGQRIVVPFELELNSGNPLIGYGFYPVTDEPAGRISIDRSRNQQEFMTIDTGSRTGTVSLLSDVDATRLDVTVVRESDIDGATLPFGAPSSIRAGTSAFLWVLPTANVRPICQAITRKSAESLTPDVCTVMDAEGLSDEEGGGRHESGWIEVEGHQSGTCQYRVSYPASGAETDLTVQIR